MIVSTDFMYSEPRRTIFSVSTSFFIKNCHLLSFWKILQNHVIFKAWAKAFKFIIFKPPSQYCFTTTDCFISDLPFHRKSKQEAHGPQFAHLSYIATADMQMLCNIFPILSLQLMKISSFEQFLVLKKNIWTWQSMEHDHLNKLSITFQQKDQCEIWWKLANGFWRIMILYM